MFKEKTFNNWSKASHKTKREYFVSSLMSLLEISDNLPVPIWYPLNSRPAPSAVSSHSYGVSPSGTDWVLVMVEGSMGVEEVEEEVVLNALWDQTWSAEGTGVDSGWQIVYGEIGTDDVVGSAGGDVMAATADDRSGWKTGPDAVTGGAGAEAGSWKGWADEAEGAGRWREVAGPCGAAEEDG